jgi:hypothetical protein
MGRDVRRGFRLFAVDQPDPVRRYRSRIGLVRVLVSAKPVRPRAQLTYTQTLPALWRWLSATLGQYSFGLYDQNEYAGNAQSNFVNYALAQNATQTYASGDLGAYAQAAAPDRKWVLAGGLQGATNLTGSGLSLRGIATGKLAYFAAAQSAPGVLGGCYGLWCAWPATPAQPSPSRGISFDAVRDINPKLGLFLRVNHASGRDSAVAPSVAWGVVVNGPLARRPFDRLGLGFAWNRTNLPAVDLPARSSEFIAEIYYNHTVFKGLKVGPDIQLYADLALAPAAGPVAVAAVGGTALF